MYSLIESELTCIRCSHKATKRIPFEKNQVSGVIDWTCDECGAKKQVRIMKTSDKPVGPLVQPITITKKKIKEDGTIVNLDENGEEVKRGGKYAARKVRARDNQVSSPDD